MADIAIQIDTTADPAAAYAALTTTDGVAGWWTTRNQTSGTVGEVDRMWFPDAPMAWELRVDEAVPGKVLARHCVGGPPSGSAPTSALPSSRRRRAGPGSCSTIPASPRSTRCSASSPSDGPRCCSASSSTWTAASRRRSSASNRPLGPPRGVGYGRSCPNAQDGRRQQHVPGPSRGRTVRSAPSEVGSSVCHL
jgi:hypothetical protein